MSKFKVGDRVRSLGYTKGKEWDVEEGVEGEVEIDDDFSVYVRWDGWDDGWWYDYDDVEAIVTHSPYAALDTTNPAHYKTGDIECIDAIRAQLTPEQFKGYLKASLVKYVWRYEHKGAALADLEKGKWFLERLIGEVRDEQG